MNRNTRFPWGWLCCHWERTRTRTKASLSWYDDGLVVAGEHNGQCLFTFPQSHKTSTTQHSLAAGDEMRMNNVVVASSSMHGWGILAWLGWMGGRLCTVLGGVVVIRRCGGQWRRTNRLNERIFAGGGSISDPKAMLMLRVGGLSRNGVRMEIL